MRQEDFIVFVFSFNRAAFLQNCLNSISKCIPNTCIYIIDDNSDDIKTKLVLSEAKRSCRVVFNDNSSDIEHKTGGLAGSMNKAMEIASMNNAKYAIFIQDDMQFVRPIQTSDLQHIHAYFGKVKNSFQISTNFIRKLSSKDFFLKHKLDREAGAYIRYKDQEKGKSNFSDTGVFHVERFHTVFNRFEVGEDNNSTKARDLDLVCGKSVMPFMCWIPYPESYRGKKKDFKHKFFEYFGRSGYYPIDVMTNVSATSFLARDPIEIPVMERYLSAPTAPRQDLWSTGGGEYNFLCYGGILSKVYASIKKIKSKIDGWR